MGAVLTRKKFVSLVATMVATLALTLAFAPSAFALPGTPVSGAFSNYKIETYSTGATEGARNLNQHVKITLKGSSEIDDIDQSAVMNSFTGTEESDPTCTITIAGRNIMGADYKRVPTVSIDPTDSKNLIIDLGPCVDANGDAIFTAQYSGVIVASGYLSGVSTTNGATTFPVSLNTVIPTGFGLNVSGEGTNQLTISVSSLANVRGMVHLAIYKDTNTASDSITYTPISSTAGTIQAFTYTIHAHAFHTMAASAYLNAISALSLPTGYSISVASYDSDNNPASLTITGPSDVELYMGVYDDDLLQSMGWSFTGRNTGTGEWGPGGNPNL